MGYAAFFIFLSNSEIITELPVSLNISVIDINRMVIYMKIKYDIYKIDNILIKAGYIFLTLFILNVYPLISKTGGDFTFINEKLPSLIFLSSGSVIMLWTGYYYRIIENRINAILKILTITSEVSLTELHRNTGYSIKNIESAIVTINKKLPYYFVLNRVSDSISDGRLTTKLARVDSCGSCGKKMNLDVSVSSDALPECPYCGIPLQPDKWNSLKREAILNIQNNEREGLSVSKGIMIPHDFSWPIFIILLIIFWPLGLLYYAVKYFKYKKEV